MTTPLPDRLEIAAIHASAVYWCLATMESFGPDEGYVHVDVCGDGRPCSRPLDEADDLPDLA